MPYVSVDGAAVWWESSGAGPAIVLINGVSSPSNTWFRLAPRLAARHRVLTLDNRGVGRTGVVRRAFDVPRMARDVVDVLDAAEVGQAHVLGLSMGGFIAQELVVTWPDRVCSLVLAATHVGIPHAAATNPEAASALQASVELPPADRARVVEPFTYWRGTPREEIDRDNVARAELPTTDAGFLSQLMATREWSRVFDLDAVTAPTLVLHGRDDQLVPAANAHQLAAAIPGARLELLGDCGHQVFTDQEQRAAEAVLAFTSEVEQTARAEAL
jgi:pimeloyl-ACP methyl ester carboxylesterase